MTNFKQVVNNKKRGVPKPNAGPMMHNGWPPGLSIGGYEARPGWSTPGAAIFRRSR
jgi:hypothetical protein